MEARNWMLFFILMVALFFSLLILFHLLLNHLFLLLNPFYTLVCITVYTLEYTRNSFEPFLFFLLFFLLFLIHFFVFQRRLLPNIFIIHRLPFAPFTFITFVHIYLLRFRAVLVDKFMLFGFNLVLGYYFCSTFDRLFIDLNNCFWEVDIVSVIRRSLVFWKRRIARGLGFFLFLLFLRAGSFRTRLVLL